MSLLLRILTGLAALCVLTSTLLLSQGLYPWDAALLLVLGVAWLAGLWLRDAAGSWQAKVRLQELSPRSSSGWLRLAGLALSMIVALAARSRPPDSGFAGLFLAWLIAVALFVISTAAPIELRGAWWRKLARQDRVGLLALLVAAFLLRGALLGRIPANLGGDEGSQLYAGLELLARPMGNPFATGWFSVPAMSFFGYGAAMRIFGASIVGGRILSALAGTLTVLTMFLLGRAIGGRRTGWVAATVMTCAAYHIHYSRLASNQIFDPLIATSALWLLWCALGLEQDAQARRCQSVSFDGSLAQTSLWRWGLVGVIAGLGWYAYFGARWVTVLVAMVVAWRVVVERDFVRRHWRGLGFLALGWLVVTLPLLGWVTRFPTTLTERSRAVSIFTSGWLAREVSITGRSTTSLLLQQVWRSVSAFHMTPDPTFWYRPGRPLVDFVSGALILLGLVDAVVRCRWPSRALAHLWFWPTLVVAWVITENPPSSQRGQLLLPVVVLFITWGIELLWDLLGRERATYPAFAAVCVALLGALNLGFYFGGYTPSQVYGNPTAQSATAFARHTLAHPQPVCADGSGVECDGRIYFVGPPFIYWQFGTLAFMLRDFPGEDVAPEALPLDVVTPARFAVVPERIAEVGLLRALYPGGEETELRGPDGRLLMVIYDWAGAP